MSVIGPVDGCWHIRTPIQQPDVLLYTAEVEEGGFCLEESSETSSGAS